VTRPACATKLGTSGAAIGVFDPQDDKVQSRAASMPMGAADVMGGAPLWRAASSWNGIRNAQDSLHGMRHQDAVVRALPQGRFGSMAPISGGLRPIDDA
jgi:uncharacterized membrane protein